MIIKLDLTVWGIIRKILMLVGLLVLAGAFCITAAYVGIWIAGVLYG